MVCVTTLLVSFILTKSTVVAYKPTGKYCPQSCEITLDYVSFNDTDAGLSKKIRHCRSENHITSVYICLNTYCQSYNADIAQWLDEQDTWCYQHDKQHLPDYHDVIGSWSPEQIAQIRRFDYTESQSWPVFDTVVLPNDSLFERTFSTLNAAYYEYDIHKVYGWFMIYFWIIVCAVGTTSRLLGLIRRVRTSENTVATTSKRLSGFQKVDVWLRKVFTTPAVFGLRCSQPYGWCTIPARAQSFTIFIFVLLNVIACTASYRLTDGNIYWPAKSAQLLRYVSDRTGIVSLANFPLIWLFGMRNDLLLWLTGWGFGTFNAFHRWIARVSTVQAVLHSIGYTVMIWESGGWKEFSKYLTKHYFWNGELSTIAMCALLVLSLYGIRRAHYDTFLITHIVLSIVALWTMYYHVEIFVGGEWNVFIWPCLAVWILDRVMRAARILLFDFKFWKTTAKITYDPDSNLIKMEVPTDRCLLRGMMLKPGAYYYLYTLNEVLYAAQNHPFTMAYLSSDNTGARSRRMSEDSSESDHLLESRSTNASKMVFLMRPYKGFTSRLKSHCLQRPAELPVLVEGPYGHSEPLHRFRNVLFVVGGTGIAVPLSYLTALLSSDSSVENVKVVWAVRQHQFLTTVLHDFKELLADTRVEMEVYITRYEESYSDESDGQVTNVRILTGRPNVRALVAEMAIAAGQESLAVMACGPALMADQARAASVAMLEANHAGVQYFEESFKW